MLSWILAWRNVWRNKRRTLITMSSIVMAVVLSSLVMSMQQGQYDQMIDNSAGKFSGHLQIQAAGFKKEPTLDNSLAWTDSLQQALSGNEQIRNIMPRIDTYALAAGWDKSRAVMVLGIDIEAEKNLSAPHQKIISGSYFESADQYGVVISEGLADYLKLSIADTLMLLGSGYQGMSATGAFPVIGIAHFGIPDLNRGLVYMPIATAQDFTGAYGRATSIALLVDDIKASTKVSRSLDVELPEYLVALDWQTIMPELVQAIEADFGSGFLILLVLYMVVGFGILGTVMMMTAERSYELGVMASIGTSRSRLASMLSLEMAMITGMGTLLGLLLSMPVIYYFNWFPIEFSGDMAEMMIEYGMEPFIEMSTKAFIPLTQAGIILGISILISLYPLWHMLRLDPVKAMRR